MELNVRAIARNRDQNTVGGYEWNISKKDQAVAYIFTPSHALLANAG